MRCVGWCWLLLCQTLLLLHLPPVLCDMTCNADGVKCVAEPTSCTSNCDFLLKYKAASADTTQIELTGKRSTYSVSSDNLWLGFGLSSSGGMSGMTVFACQKYGDSYSVKKRATTGYGVSSSTTDIADGNVVGSLNDGVMNCKCTIKNSNLLSSNLKMGYGMGRMYSTDGMSKHSRTPRITSSSFSLIQPYNAPTKTCNKPTVTDGTVSPDTATINSGATYKVTCKSGFTLSGSNTITCTNGALSKSPLCTKNPPAACSKPSVNSGRVEPDTASIASGAQYTVTCNDNYKISGSGTVSCTDGTLSTLPSCIELKTCSKPTVPGGSVAPDSSTITSGAHLTVTCSGGHTLTGPSKVTCTDGTLSQLPACTKVTSCKVPEVLHGSVSPDSPTVSSGSKVLVVCSSGFVMSGPEMVTCSEGVLSELPTCSAKKDDDKTEDKTEDKTDPNKCDIKSGCYRVPSDCTTSCTYSLRWSESSGVIKVEQTGKLSEFSMSDSSKVWVAFGLSKYGTMANSNIYLCKKNMDTFSAVKVKGYSHGLTRSSAEQLKDGTVTGSVVDGVLNCTFHVKTSNLPNEALTLFYGMGPVRSSDGLAANHYKTPTSTSDKFNIVTRSVGSSSHCAFLSSLILTLGLFVLLL